MTALTQQYTLANGVEIPALGFGTWQVPDGDVAYDSVAAALAAGYRHIDTANAYANEESVGRAIRDSGLQRNEIFVTTKLPAAVKSFEGALASFDESQSALGLEYVDLYLIHAPWPWTERGADYSAGNAEAWRAMERIYESGAARSIGVSNFEVSDLTKLAAASQVTPHVNQIQFYIGNTQEETSAYCRAHDILVEAYSPLATGKLLGNTDLQAVADRYEKSVAQLSIRYVLQKGVLPLPKSTTPSRIIENSEVDFVIEPEDVEYLDGLHDTI